MNKNKFIELSASLISAASVVGKKEHEGPLGECFDMHDCSDSFGEATWEKSESEMQRMALSTALSKAEMRPEELDCIFAGDLLNQCIGSSYGLIDFDVPYIGLYGACSTAVEGMMLGSAFVTHGIYGRCAAVTSSHNCSAERQYRNPIEYGCQKPPTAQWTVTGSGAFIIGERQRGEVSVDGMIPGIVVERGITDANNMGAAMAPAAADTILRYVASQNGDISDIDLIVTGDLGHEGSEILCSLLECEGVNISGKHTDCGILIYDKESQGTLSGGSGCGCSAVVLASHFLPKLRSGEFRSILAVGTGAMMSPDSVKQGEPIPAIAHLVKLSHT